jgi:polyphosphate kinase
VEALAPVEEPTLIAQVRDMLDRCLADNTHAWQLEPDGTWLRRAPEGERRWAQNEMMERSLRMAQASSGRPVP